MRTAVLELCMRPCAQQGSAGHSSACLLLRFMAITPRSHRAMHSLRRSLSDRLRMHPTAQTSTASRLTLLTGIAALHVRELLSLRTPVSDSFWAVQ